MSRPPDKIPSMPTLSVTPKEMSLLRGIVDEPESRQYVLVFEGESSQMFPLPRNGEVVVGRGDDAGLRLADRTVSRHHARIRVSDGVATIEDLGSQNGTYVNGVRLSEPRELRTGDELKIRSALLVVYTNEAPRRRTAVVDVDSFRDQVEAEAERAVAYQRSFGVLAITGTITEADHWGVVHALRDELRRMDRVAWATVEQAYLLFPEADSDAAEELASRVLAAVSARHKDARVGYATCPRDGCHVDTLLSAARNALATAQVGQVASAAAAYRVIDVGDRQAIVADDAMTRLYALLERLAAADLPVLVTGETGTGKDIAAAAVHAFSRRADKPLVSLNCAALQDTLVESELFGHEKGAFSGAGAAKPGLLETANGGTVFFDEVASLSPASQAKLLRVIETKKFTRVGDIKERMSDVRIVAAANQDLRAEVQAGRFREDLYFRLSAATVWLPPLRDRRTEVPILATRFLATACERAARDLMSLSEDAMRALSAHSWPGNVRELKNAIDYLAATVPGATIDAWHVEQRLGLEPAAAEATLSAAAMPAPVAGHAPNEFRPIKDELADLERQRMVQALAAAEENQTKAAQLIHMPLRTFVARLKKYDIR